MELKRLEFVIIWAILSSLILFMNKSNWISCIKSNILKYLGRLAGTEFKSRHLNLRRIVFMFWILEAGI